MKTAKFFSRFYFLSIFFLIGLMYSAHAGGKQITQFSLITLALFALWIIHVKRMNKRFMMLQKENVSIAS